jgi:hypothetical protein
MAHPFELFWEDGGSAGNYRSEAEALQAVGAMVDRANGEAAFSELVLAKIDEDGRAVRLAEGEELAALAKLRSAGLRRPA